MKKVGFIILALVIISIIIYVTFIIAVVKVAVGGILIVVAALVLWGLYNKLEKKLE
jgi:hypothetical protein